MKTPAASNRSSNQLSYNGRVEAGAWVVIALMLPFAGGCSSRIAGSTYVDGSGTTQYEFHTDGRVYISVLGATASGMYETSGDRVLITGPQGTVVLVREQDRLIGPMGLELRRSEHTPGGSRAVPDRT